MLPVAAAAVIDPTGLRDCDLPGDCAQVGMKAATGCSLSAWSTVTHKHPFFKKQQQQHYFSDLHQYKG